MVKRDILPPEKPVKSTSPCGNCKLCPLIKTDTSISNLQAKITKQIITGGNCKTTGLIYAATCKKHQLLYVGHTGKSLSSRFSNHRYDINKRPENNELASHFAVDHDMDRDLEIQIVESGISDKRERVMKEDKWICRLQTLQPQGLNADCGPYAKETYEIWKKT